MVIRNTPVVVPRMITYCLSGVAAVAVAATAAAVVVVVAVVAVAAGDA